MKEKVVEKSSLSTLMGYKKNRFSRSDFFSMLTIDCSFNFILYCESSCFSTVVIHMLTIHFFDNPSRQFTTIGLMAAAILAPWLPIHPHKTIQMDKFREPKIIFWQISIYWYFMLLPSSSNPSPVVKKSIMRMIVKSQNLTIKSWLCCQLWGSN